MQPDALAEQFALFLDVLDTRSFSATARRHDLTPSAVARRMTALEVAIGSQLLVQAEGVVITMVWSAVVAFIVYKIVDMVLGLRVSEEAEREGLDISSHGETAYNR